MKIKLSLKVCVLLCFHSGARNNVLNENPTKKIIEKVKHIAGGE